MLKMINATSLRSSLNDAAMPAATGGDPADPAGFASLLRQTQVASAPAPSLPHAETLAHRETAATPEPATTSASTDDAQAPHETDNEAAANAPDEAANRARPQVKTRARNSNVDTASTASTPRPAGDAEKSSTAADAKAADGATPASSTGVPAMDPAVAQWLASLQRPAAAPASAERGTAPADDTTAALADTSGGARTLKAADLKVQDDINDKLGRGGDRFKAEFNPVVSTAVLAEQRVEERSTTSTRATGVTEVTGANAAVPSASTASAREADAPTVVALPTPVDAPDFAQALGVQMSVLTRDGVQQAELHLNPADMGPVSVQIVMDGTQARIDFGADVAATRQAIEAGLPELASALRDAGFTLAGGGVSQHSGGRGDANASNGRDEGPQGRGPARRVSDDTVAKVGSAARRLVSAGGLDLYA